MIFSMVRCCLRGQSAVLRWQIRSVVQRRYFAELMNKKARKLGMENTHFCDSTGLHNPDHYSTVKDIAVFDEVLH